MDIIRTKAYLDQYKINNQSFYLDTLDKNLDLSHHYALLVLSLSSFAHIKNYEVKLNKDVIYDEKRLNLMTNLFNHSLGNHKSYIYMMGPDYHQAMDILSQHNSCVNDIQFDHVNHVATCKVDYRLEEYWQQLVALSTLNVDITRVSINSIVYCSKGYFNVLVKSRYLVYLPFLVLLESYSDISFEELMFFGLYFQVSKKSKKFLLEHMNTEYIKSMIFQVSKLKTFEAESEIKKLIRHVNFRVYLNFSYDVIQKLIGDSHV